MNKKALALVLALIISIPLTLVPMSGAFADSDIGISNSLLLSCFAWYSGTPGVDSAGIWYGSSFEEYSDSIESGVDGTTSFGVQCLLNTSGDYVDYQLNEYPFYANSWNSPILIVQLLLDRSSYGGPVEDLAYQFYTDTNDVIYEPFYQYVVPRFTLNNTDYVVMNLFFNIGVSVNSGHPHIKIMYDGTPANFIAMGMRFMGYRYLPEATLTTAELYQIQTDLIMSFNIARLLDAIGSDDSDIDLSNIENALASMDAKLTTIVSNTDNVETLLNYIYETEGDIYSLLNTFYQYVHAYYSDTSFNRSFSLSSRIYRDGTEYTNLVTSDFTSIISTRYHFALYFSNIEANPNSLICVFIPITSTTSIKSSDIQIEYYRNSRFDWEDKYITYPAYFVPSFNRGIYVYLYAPTSFDGNVIHIKISAKSYLTVNNDQSKYVYSSSTGQQSYFQRIIAYLHMLFMGKSSTSVSDDIADTTQSVSSNAQTVEQFETTYNTQLQDAHDDVDLSGYAISATSGMTYLKTYTHNAFTVSNGLRVFMIYPIIFVLIGIFLRRFA